MCSKMIPSEDFRLGSRAKRAEDALVLHDGVPRLFLLPDRLREPGAAPRFLQDSRGEMVEI